MEASTAVLYAYWWQRCCHFKAAVTFLDIIFAKTQAFETNEFGVNS